MSSIQLITFDLDNTLWDVEPAIRRAEQTQRQWLLNHRPGVMENLDDAALLTLKKQHWRAHPKLTHNLTAMRKRLLHRLQQDAGYSEDECAEGTELAFAAFLKERQNVTLYADALPVLKQLAERFRLAALTNGNADVYKTDAGPYFEFAFLAEEVGASKPAPDLFHAALKRSELAPTQVLHVGDNHEHDVLGALNVGMHAIWLNAEGTAAVEDKSANETRPHHQQADAVIERLIQLPQAIEEIVEKKQSAMR